MIYFGWNLGNKYHHYNQRITFIPTRNISMIRRNSKWLTFCWMSLFILLGTVGKHPYRTYRCQNIVIYNFGEKW